MATTGDGCDCLTCTERECTCPHAWVEVTLILPADSEKQLASKLPTVAGKWVRLPDGSIAAIYTPRELKTAVDVMLIMLAGRGAAAHGLYKNGRGGDRASDKS